MKINILLPFKEKFDENRASSVALTVKNNLFHSKFINNTKIYGQQVEEPLFIDNFVGFKYSIFSFKSRNEFLAHKMLEIISKDTEKNQLIEVHNRPYLINKIASKSIYPISLFFHNDPQRMRGSKSVTDRENLLKKCVVIFCVSEYVKKKFLEGIINNAEKVQILYNGVPKKLKKFPKKKKEVLFVGRLVPEKGAHFYVGALKLVTSLYPDWKFGLIGSFRLGNNENTNSYAKKVIKNFENIGPQAKFYGFKDHKFVEEKMKTASIIVIPSIWQEPFGLVAAEAMSYGVCIIASKVGGLPEIIEGNGILLDYINNETLGKKIIALIQDDKLRMKYQKNAWLNFKLSSIKSSQKLDTYRETIISKSF